MTSAPAAIRSRFFRSISSKRNGGSAASRSDRMESERDGTESVADMEPFRGEARRTMRRTAKGMCPTAKCRYDTRRQRSATAISPKTATMMA